MDHGLQRPDTHRWRRKSGSETPLDSGSGLITAFGESVGSTIMARFVNALPTNMEDWYKQPPGIVNELQGAGSEVFLKRHAGCTSARRAPPGPPGTPSATASPTASP